jgi:hypothetical protein
VIFYSLNLMRNSIGSSYIANSAFFVPFVRFAAKTFSFVALCLCVSHSALAQVGLPKPGEIGSMGVNIHFTDPKPGEMEQIAAAGFKWIRMDFAWAGIERVRGQYDFSAYERLLAHLQKFNIRAIFILDYGNDIYEKGSPKTQEARAAFARFAAAAATHFKGKGVLWEMWNEPNGGFWTPKANVDEYIALALETGKAFKAAQPNEMYIGPATSGMDFTFIERCFQVGLLSYWDAVSFHPYRNSSPETAIPDYNHVKALIAQYAPKGKQIPIISGEWGYSELYPGLSLDLQSKYISREFLTNISNDLIVSIWYDWHDDGPDPKEEEHHFGTVYQDYMPKPTYTAAKTMSTALSGLHYNKRLALGNPSDYCLLFSGPNDKLCLAAWTTEKAPHAVALPASAGEFEVTSNLGEKSAVSADQAGIHIELSGAAVYLKPRIGNRLLATISRWGSLSTATWCDSEDEVTHALDTAYNIAGAERFLLRPLPVTLTNESTGKPLLETAINVDNGEIEHLSLGNLDWERRNPMGVLYRAALRLPGSAVATQRTVIYPTHPLLITAAAAQNNRLPVTVDNPTGAAISGRVRLGGTGRGVTADVTFKHGETQMSVSLPAPAATDGRYRVQLAFEEPSGANGKWETTLTSPAVDYQPFETFSEFNEGAAPPGSEYTVEPDGDPKVKSRLSISVEGAPAGLPGEPRKALRIDYSFDPGWKFLRLAPHGTKHDPLAGKPTGLGMMVNGDGSDNILNIRYIDSTGQTFQTSAGAIDWKGWRFIQFSLLADHASHWGGGSDGVIHYPIAFDTIALVDSHDQRGGSGRIWVKDLVVSRR